MAAISTFNAVLPVNKDHDQVSHAGAPGAGAGCGLLRDPVGRAGHAPYLERLEREIAAMRAKEGAVSRARQFNSFEIRRPPQLLLCRPVTSRL